jgi:hypothetical protein
MVATVGSSSSATAVADSESSSAPDDSLCILWEPMHPNLLSEKFLIVPKSIHREADQDEATVKVDTLEGLLPFEIDPFKDSDVFSGREAKGSGKDAVANITTWKERGDQLLRLGDASAAASYYEKALCDSSSVSIGGTVILSVEGFPRVAEVDCIDDDDDDGGMIDVTLVHNGDETTVKRSAVLLGILEPDVTILQERILLNLARCMLQLSDLDAANRPKYLKAAILATTLVITLSLFRQQQDDEDEPLLLPSNAQTALVLRCKAYTSLSKWAKATSDARKLVQRGSNEEQGRKLLVGIERKKKLQSKTDKKLAKDICRLVQSATAANESRTSTVSQTASSSTGTTASQRKSARDNNGFGEQDATGRRERQEPSTHLRSFSTPPAINGFPSIVFVAALVIVLLSILLATLNASSS